MSAAKYSNVDARLDVATGFADRVRLTDSISEVEPHQPLAVGQTVSAGSSSAGRGIPNGTGVIKRWQLESTGLVQRIVATDDWMIVTYRTEEYRSQAFLTFEVSTSDLSLSFEASRQAYDKPITSTLGIGLSSASGGRALDPPPG